MKKTFLLLFILCSINNFAQSDAEKELGVWYMYNGSHKVSEKFSIKTMAHFRFFEIGDDMQQLITRIGFNYKINKSLSVTLGHSFLNTDATFEADGGNVNEDRIYEDFNVKYKINKLGFAHRFRAEQRFFNQTTSHFLRYQIAMSYPLNSKWSSFLYNETFFDFDDEAYNQNWLGAGFTYAVSKSAKLKFGYQHINTNAGANFNRLLVGVNINTDFTK